MLRSLCVCWDRVKRAGRVYVTWILHRMQKAVQQGSRILSASSLLDPRKRTGMQPAQEQTAS